MPVIEMEEDVLSHMGGKLAPKADQKRFVSTWAIRDNAGRDMIGFPNARDLQQPQPFGHGSGRAISGYQPLKVPVPGTKKGETMDHIVHLNGVPLVEMICDRESVEMRDKWCGTVSKHRVEAIKQEELDRLDRQGIKTEEGNMKERLVEDADAVPGT